MPLTRRPSALPTFRDIGLFLRSARSDARLQRLRGTSGNRSAFDTLYGEAVDNDPWASADPRFHYQRRKYEAIMQMVPRRPYARALDLGCGTGLLTERLAASCDEVVGIDISDVALRRAVARTERLGNVRFEQGDIRTPSPALAGQFDLVVVADTLYYLPEPIDAATLRDVAGTLAALLSNNGILMVINHYFPLPIASSRLTLQIHDAVRSVAKLRSVAVHKRAFYLTEIFAARPP